MFSSILVRNLFCALKFTNNLELRHVMNTPLRITQAELKATLLRNENVYTGI